MLLDSTGPQPQVLVAQSCLTLWDPTNCSPPLLSMKFSRQEYWSGLSLPSPGGSSWPKDRTQVSCIAGRFFTTEPPAKPHRVKKQLSIFLWPSCPSVPLTTTQDQLCYGGMSSLVWILCWLSGRKSLASLRNTSTQSSCLGPLEFQWLYALVVGGRVIPAYVQPNRGLLQETCSEGRDRLFWRGWCGS